MPLFIKYAKKYLRNIKLKISFIINIKQRRDEWFSFARCYPATNPGASQARFHILSLDRLWRCVPLPGEGDYLDMMIVNHYDHDDDYYLFQVKITENADDCYL